MSLGDDLDALAPRIVATRPPRILVIDIERIKGTFAGDFFDLNDMKGRRIPADWVTEWPRTVCAAWRWYGNKRVEFAAEWDDGHEAMLRHVWGLYDQADIVVGHNIDRFDTRKLNGEWAVLGLPEPSPVKSVDTLKVARSRFALESNTLDAIAKRLGLPGKVDHYDARVARAAVDGDKAAQRRLRTYNRGDIVTTEAVYDRLRPWIKNHPHIGLWSGDEFSCPACGCTELVPSDWAKTAVTAYAMYRCSNCSVPVRATHVKARTTTRNVVR